MPDEPWTPPEVMLAVDLVILTLRESRLQVLLVERGVEPYQGKLALPGGFLRHREEDLTTAAHRELAEEADLDVRTLRLEHLGVYGDPGRDPRGRVVSVAFLAIAPRLPEPVAGTDAAAARWQRADQVLSGDLPLAFDHRRIVADGVERARAKLEHSALATAFCGPTFTISDLQDVYEAVWGIPLDPRNFYRKVQKAEGFIVPAGSARKPTAGRPARLFKPGPNDVLHPPMVRPTGAGEHRSDAMSHCPIVILTALDLEYDAVRARMSGRRLHRHPRGTRFEVGRLGDGDCRVALALVGKGNQASAVLTERAISEFRPAALLFVGVAGALQSHIALGDVVVATHVYAFHGGTSEDDGFKGRPRVWETSHAADQIARHVAREGAWAHGLAAGGRTPMVHFGAIAAGEIVLNSRDSAHARWIREHYNDARAIEMEGAGIAQAGHLNNVNVVVIRGISDRADGEKEKTDGEQWQPRAAANAAAFAAALAVELAADPATAEGSAETETRSREMSGNRNIARDQARVGMQIGTVYGGVRSGHDMGSPADLAEALTGLRARIHGARAAGRLDDETYAAAEAELTAADAALRENNTSQARSALMLALKKVRGLLADIAELAAEVASVIALARSMS